MSMDEALAEAYASAPIDDIPLDTIEMHHPAFKDEFGNPTAIRVVRANEPWMLTLEASAPLNPGEEVEFLPVPFDFTPPGFSENQVPSLTFSISNVSRLVTQYLEQAIAQTSPITLYYRNYLASDTSAPQINPVIVMTLKAAESGTMQVTGTASLSDVHNWPFPAEKYTPDRFPGLLR